MIDEICFQSFIHSLARHNDKCVVLWQAQCVGIYHVAYMHCNHVDIMDIIRELGKIDKWQHDEPPC